MLRQLLLVTLAALASGQSKHNITDLPVTYQTGESAELFMPAYYKANLCGPTWNQMGYVKIELLFPGNPNCTANTNGCVLVEAFNSEDYANNMAQPIGTNYEQDKWGNTVAHSMIYIKYNETVVDKRNYMYFRMISDSGQHFIASLRLEATDAPLSPRWIYDNTLFPKKDGDSEILPFSQFTKVQHIQTVANGDHVFLGVNFCQKYRDTPLGVSISIMANEKYPFSAFNTYVCKNDLDREAVDMWCKPGSKQLTCKKNSKGLGDCFDADAQPFNSIALPSGEADPEGNIIRIEGAGAALPTCTIDPETNNTPQQCGAAGGLWLGMNHFTLFAKLSNN